MDQEQRMFILLVPAETSLEKLEALMEALQNLSSLVEVSPLMEIVCNSSLDELAGKVIYPSEVKKTILGKPPKLLSTGRVNLVRRQQLMKPQRKGGRSR